MNVDPIGFCKCGEAPIQLYISYSPVGPGYHIEVFGYDSATGNFLDAGGRGGIDNFRNLQPLSADVNTAQLKPNMPDFGQNFSKISKWPVRQLPTLLCYEDVLQALKNAASDINAWGTWYSPDPDAIPFSANSNTAAAYMLESLGFSASDAAKSGYWTPWLYAGSGFAR